MSNIDYEWFFNRLWARGVSRKCPRCRSERWAGLGQNQDQMVRLPSYDLNGNPVGVISDTFGMGCLNCGFLSLHALAPLLGDVESWPERQNP